MNTANNNEVKLQNILQIDPDEEIKIEEQPSKTVNTEENNS